MNNLQEMLDRNQPHNVPYAEDGSMQLTPEEKAYFFRKVMQHAFAEGGSVDEGKDLTEEQMADWKKSGLHYNDYAMSANNDRNAANQGGEGAGGIQGVSGFTGDDLGGNMYPTYDAQGKFAGIKHYVPNNMTQEMLKGAVLVGGTVLGANALSGLMSAAPAATTAVEVAPTVFNPAVDSALVSAAPYSGSVPASVNLGIEGVTGVTGATELGLGSTAASVVPEVAAKSWAETMAAKLGPKVTEFLTNPMNLIKYGPAALGTLGAITSKPQAASSGATPNPDQRSLNQWDWDKIKAEAAAANMPISQFVATRWDKLYGGQYNAQPVKAAHGGALSRLVQGNGAGRDDAIDAKLSDGEYVMDAETVSLLGDGSNKAGALRLDQMRSNLREHKGAALSKGKISANAKSPLQYIKEFS